MPKISGLPPMNSPADDDVLAIDDDSVADPTSPDKTKKISLSTLYTYLLAKFQAATSWISKSMINWSTGGIWWEELDRDTAAGNVESLTATFTAKKYLKIIIIAIPSGNTGKRLSFNGDTGNNYRSRFSISGAADTDEAATSGIPLGTTNADPAFSVTEVINISNQEKLTNSKVTQRGSTGTANATSRMEVSSKWVNTAAQITSATITASLAAGSEIIVLGHD